jgi:aminopeptidase
MYYNAAVMKEHISQYLGQVLEHAIELGDAQALVVYDEQASLTKILVDGYRAHVPEEGFINFDKTTPEAIRERIDALQPGDLVVLVQSTSFRLNEFRFRIELFKRDLKTIEHVHLNRYPEDQFDRYVETLNYQPDYYRPLGHALKAKIDTCSRAEVVCPGTKLVYETSFETAKLNIGDYSALNNVGGTFPIGEVFSEAVDFSKVNGEVKIFAFAGKDHIVQEHKPFVAIIKEGILSSPDAPAEFQEVLDMIREDSPVYVREFGMSLNPAIGKGRILNDVTAFERMLGLHLSLGAKHSMYKKPGLPRKRGGYHVDVFLDLETITIDNEVVFKDGKYIH